MVLSLFYMWRTRAILMDECMRLIGDLGQCQEIVRAETGAVLPATSILVRARERYAVHRPTVISQVNLAFPDRGTERAVSDRVDRRV